jgi:hypothetical protein
MVFANALAGFGMSLQVCCSTNHTMQNFMVYTERTSQWIHREFETAHDNKDRNFPRGIWYLYDY